MGFYDQRDGLCFDEEVINPSIGVVWVREVGIVPLSRVQFPPDIRKPMGMNESSYFETLFGRAGKSLCGGPGFVQPLIKGSV